MAATVLSPEDYYNLVLLKDSSQAIQVLERIPLDSRHPCVSFKNEKGEPRFRGQITLHAAVRAGHIQLVQLLLDSGSDKDAPMADGTPPLSLAAQEGHHQVVELLLTSGADKKAARNDGRTPMWQASYFGHHHIVELLLAARVDKNAPDNEGYTSIYVASQRGHFRVVELLLSAGADRNAANKNGATPIFIASSCGHLNIVELLIAAGADTNAATKDGWTPLYVASQKDIIKWYWYYSLLVLMHLIASAVSGLSVQLPMTLPRKILTHQWFSFSHHRSHHPPSPLSEIDNYNSNHYLMLTLSNTYPQKSCFEK